MVILGSGMGISYPTRTAPPGQLSAQTAQPVQRSSSIMYPSAPGYGPPATGTIAPRGQARRAGQPGERSQLERSMVTVRTSDGPFTGGLLTGLYTPEGMQCKYRHGGGP